jgi:hypothetical protein
VCRTGDAVPQRSHDCDRYGGVTPAPVARRYAFQIETTYHTLRAGFRVEEIPIVFSDRAAGGSKMGKRIVLEAIWKVPALKLERWRPRTAEDDAKRKSSGSERSQ